MKQLLHVPLDQIRTEKQVRTEFDDEALATLEVSLLDHGQLQPCLVRRQGDHYLIVDGERRFRAAQLATLPTLAVVVQEDDLSEREILERQYVSNVLRAELRPIEKSLALDTLVRSTGWSMAQVAKRLGLSPAATTRSLALLTLPSSIQAQVNAGTIPPSAAYELSQVEDPAEQLRLASELAEGNLTRDGLSRQRKSPPQQPPKATKVSRLATDLGEGRSITVVSPNLNLDSYLALLEELLSAARRARQNGLTLKTLASMLKDRSQAPAKQSGTSTPPAPKASSS